MSSLQYLTLAVNRISTIGSNVFTAKAGLTSLHDIMLDSNELTELEPWPFIRGQLVPHCLVSLTENRIAKFTNGLGWSFRCGMKPQVKMTLNLMFNSMGHLTDMFEGWNITGTLTAVSFFIPVQPSESYPAVWYLCRV